MVGRCNLVGEIQFGRRNSVWSLKLSRGLDAIKSRKLSLVGAIRSRVGCEKYCTGGEITMWSVNFGGRNSILVEEIQCGRYN